MEIEILEILVVHPQLYLLQTLIDALSQHNFLVRSTGSILEAMTCIESSPPAFAVLALRINEYNGLDLLDRIKAARPDARVVITTRHGDVPTAVAATKKGAVDYLLEPIHVDDVVSALLPHGARWKALKPEAIREDYIVQTYQQCKTVSETARHLGMHRRTLQRILRKIQSR